MRWPGRTARPSTCQAADQALPGGRLVEAAVPAQRLHGARELGRGGDVTAGQAAGREHRGDRVDAAPRARACPGRPGRSRPVPSGLNSPVTSCQAGGAPPKNCSTLLRAISAKSGLRSNETSGALLPHRAQQPAAQRARAGPGLEHPRAGEHVGERHDLRRVLGVDHRRAALHRPACSRPAAGGTTTYGVPPQRADHVPVRAADDVVVAQRAPVGVERRAGPQGDQVACAPSGRSAGPARPASSGPCRGLVMLARVTGAGR